MLFRKHSRLSFNEFLILFLEIRKIWIQLLFDLIFDVLHLDDAVDGSEVPDFS